MSKVFKILSIDGGGIKGLYSSTIIEHFEEQFDCNISDYFDMICGTSTGGILALGLSLNLKAHEISKLYKEEGPKIFPNQNSILAWFKQMLISGKYSNVELRKALEDTFQEKTIGESNCLLCIPSYSVTEAKNTVFKYDHEENELSRDNETKYVDVALATSAAPTYLPMIQLSGYDNNQFIDGGIWANNPSLVGMIEALTYFVGEGKEFDEIKILSISSLNKTSGEQTGLNNNRSFRHWRQNLIETMMTSQANFNDYFMSQIHKVDSIPISHIRVPSEIVGSKQEKFIDLDKTTKKSMELLSTKGNSAGFVWRKKEEIKEFFESKKEYKIS